MGAYVSNKHIGRGFLHKRKARFNRKKYGQLKKKSLTAKVKSIVRNKLEAAHHYVYNDDTAFSLKHGSIYTSSLLTEIGQGTSNATRVGDEIFLEAFKAKFKFQTTPGTTDVKFRVMLVKSGIEVGVGLGGLWTAAGLNTGNIFFNPTPGDGDLTRLLTDPKRVTVVFDRVFTARPQFTTHVMNLSTINITIPIKATHLYNSNSAYAKFKNYYWIVTPWQNGGTVGTTTVGSMNMNCDVIFKNEA